MDCLANSWTRTSLVLASPLSDFLIFERFSIVNESCAAEIAVSKRRSGILWAVCQPCRGASRRDKSAASVGLTSVRWRRFEYNGKPKHAAEGSSTALPARNRRNIAACQAAAGLFS
jgi:hypothetical protein